MRCRPGYSAHVLVTGLESPDGLALAPDGALYVAEERAGRVVRINPGGGTTPVAEGLSNPEGIAFDNAGNLYVVEDVAGGRLLRVAPNGSLATLVADRDAPEGVVWTSDETIYITESNVQFTANPSLFQTRVTVVRASGTSRTLLTNHIFWSYAGIALGPDGLLYVTNEASGVGTDDSVFTIDPTTGERRVFVRGLGSPEGLRFASSDGFPLYVAEEDVDSGNGRLSQVTANGSHSPFCTGFYTIEDVAVGPDGELYVSEDGSGSVIMIERRWTLRLPLVGQG